MKRLRQEVTTYVAISQPQNAVERRHIYNPTCYKTTKEEEEKNTQEKEQTT